MNLFATSLLHTYLQLIMKESFQPETFNKVVAEYEKELRQDQPDISTLEEFEITVRDTRLGAEEHEVGAVEQE